MEDLLKGAGVGLVGMISLIAGGAWAALHAPGARTRSIVQHMAAGTVFAGLAADVLDRLLSGKPSLVHGDRHAGRPRGDRLRGGARAGAHLSRPDPDRKLGGDGWGTARRLLMPALIGLGVVAGGVLGAWARRGPEELVTGIEGFGAIALAYLVVEELLREVHEQEEKPSIAATFFAGFIPSSWPPPSWAEDVHGSFGGEDSAAGWTQLGRWRLASQSRP